MPPQLAMRQKRFSARSRNGCYTCRARHIKCDETRPSCNNCISGNRQCSGYALDKVMSKPSFSGGVTFMENHHVANRFNDDRGIATLPHHIAPPTVKVTSQSQLVMHFFRTQASQQVGGAFDQQFWTIDLLQATLSHPIIWYSCSAMAAFYWKANAKHYLLNQSDVIGKLKIFGLAQYNYALKLAIGMAMQTHLSVDEKQVLLMTNLLFTGIEYLQGTPDHAMVHLNKGIQLFYQWNLAEKAFQPNAPNNILSVDSLVSLFRRLFAQSHTYRDREWPNILSPDNLEYTDFGLFRCIEDAYVAQEHIYNHQISIWRMEHSAATKGEPSPQRDANYSSRIAFERWTISFEEALRRGDLKDEEGLLILQIRSLSIKIGLSINYSLGELAFDDFSSEFAGLLDLAEKLIQVQARKRGTIKAFSFSASITEQLAMVCTKCRDPKLRNRSLQLLFMLNLREGIYDTTELALLNKRIMDLEAECLTRAKDPLDEDCYCVQHKFICGDHRICAQEIQYYNGELAVLIKTVRDIRLGNHGTIRALYGTQQ